MHDHTSPHLHSTMAVPRGVQAYRCTGWGYSSAVLTFSTRLFSSSSTCSRKYDAVIVGGGHNGLVAAAYIAKAGQSVGVFERRHLVGGAAVTEEIVPGFKFSRASYLLSLLRPVVVKELELKKHGFKVYLRDPSSYTPLRGTKDYLLLSSDAEENRREISKFSKQDAESYLEYEEWLNKIAMSLDPILDNAPVNLVKMTHKSKMQQLKSIPSILALGRTLSSLKQDLPSFYELIQSPASKIRQYRWFESEPLKATLATDSVIGAMLSPQLPGSGYVLLHHVMGELEGKRNAWGYAEGGMGSVSNAIAKAALSHGADIFTEKPVQQIIVEDGRAVGIRLESGEEVYAKIILSNATPKVTFLDLLPKECLSKDFKRLISSIDYSSGVTKINVALSGLPNFTATPHTGQDPAPHHRCTIHLNTETMGLIHDAYIDAQQGMWSRRPMLELCIPSSMDPTLAPPGCHVLSIFSQYTPYTLHTGPWTDQDREEYANCVFDTIESYAPGFRKLVVGKEVLTPSDLERIFGLTGGNIFHGAVSTDQLYMTRPTYLNPSYSCPVPGLFLCGSGAHPGGGVMGAPGRLAALTALKGL